MPPQVPPGRIVAVTGATATGKSALGIAVARAVGGEIVNADSMQLYRGMDIGTAKLRPDEMAGVPHHLLDVWEVTRTASVADYQVMARAEIEAIRSRGRVPVLVGGSGLYVRAVIDDVSFPATDALVRSRLEAELAAGGSGRLHSRLAALDPAAAARILPSNGRKIVRALEVIEVMGTPFTAELDPGQAYDDVVLIGLRVDRDVLRERIAERVARMWDAGLVAEVDGLVAAGLRGGVTASRALGYAQVLAMRDGTMDEPAAKEATVHATRRFARRQASWWRRDPRIRWLDAVPGDPPDVTAAALELALS